MKKPSLKVLSGPHPAQVGVADAGTEGMASALSAFSGAVDFMPHDEVDLYHYLNFRRGIAEQAAKRGSWFGGRWYNQMAGEDPEYVQLSGAHLRQTLSVARITIPEFVVADGEYALRLDHVITALDALKAQGDQTNS